MKLHSLGPRVASLDLRRVSPAQKQAAAMYGTPEHREWRAEVLRRADWRCQSPGCGRRGVRLFADHVVEARDGGALLDPGNGQALCGSCHTAKTARARAARAAGAPSGGA